MSHTPGPWLVREPEDGELHEIYAENGGDLICYPVYTANQKANLPLIASAPELLEALNAAKGTIEYLLANSDNGPAENCIEIIAAAIAKAEGGTYDQ